MGIPSTVEPLYFLYSQNLHSLVTVIGHDPAAGVDLDHLAMNLSSWVFVHFFVHFAEVNRRNGQENSTTCHKSKKFRRKWDVISHLLLRHRELGYQYISHARHNWRSLPPYRKI